MQTSHFIDPDSENFPPQSSSVDQVLSVSGNLQETLSNNPHGLPQNDSINHIQNNLDIFLIVFCSVLDQFSSVENPDTS